MHDETKVDYTTSGPLAVVCISGELDVAIADDVAAVADRLSVESGGTIRIDLQEVTFIDSVGLRALLRFDRLAERCAASIELLEPSPAVIRVLTLTGLLDHYAITSALADNGGRRMDRRPDLVSI